MKKSLDLSLFRWVDSQTTEWDRRALLSILEVVCGVANTYRYLEVGSHLGGSLQPHAVDPRCIGIYSIDPRPLEQPDERWSSNYKYEGNSTERMLKLLSAIPGADIGKIRTFEASSWELEPTSIPATIDFAFIDGEHTNASVTRDFVAVRRFLSPSSILAFHDCFVTRNAFIRISEMLRTEQERHCFLYYPGSAVVAIAFRSEPMTEALLGFGWKRGLPIMDFYLQAIKLFLQRHIPGLFSVLRHWRHFLRAKKKV